MSKNIIIQEGGISKQMTVNKLKTDKVGGGTSIDPDGSGYSDDSGGSSYGGSTGF